jgi:glycosyltransferase 2 family protein
VRSFVDTEEKERPRSRLSVWLRPTIRLAVGFGLIFFLISRSDISAIKQVLASANPFLILAGYFLSIGLLVVSAFRWRIFLEALEVELSILSILRLTFVGAFFNAFLPTGVGGDAYKAFRIRTGSTTLATSFASVLLDRVAGIAVLAFLGFLAAITAIRSGITPLVVAGFVLSVGVLALAIFVLLMGQNLVGTGRRTWFGIRPRIRRALDAAANAIRRPSTIRRSFAIGVLCQVFGLAAYAALAHSLGLGIPLEIVTLGLFSATVVSAIPITINGLGIREAVWVWGLGIHGIAQGEALAYALLVLGMSLATSAVGGAVYAIRGGDVTVPEGTQRH